MSSFEHVIIWTWHHVNMWTCELINRSSCHHIIIKYYRVLFYFLGFYWASICFFRVFILSRCPLVLRMLSSCFPLSSLLSSSLCYHLSSLSSPPGMNNSLFHKWNFWSRILSLGSIFFTLCSKKCPNGLWIFGFYFANMYPVMFHIALKINVS